jgi:O-antigen/teichoic acid export membrane protein
MTRRASLLHSLPPVYAAAAVRVLFPLIVLPAMAVRLGPEEFGRLGLCLVWASLLGVVVEGGFMAAAMRLAVTADAARRLTLARRVFSARCALSLPVVLAGLAIGGFVVPATGAGTADQAETAVLMAVLGCSIGWTATWYLQGTSQLHRWAWVELAVHGASLAACLLLAHSVVGYLLLQLLASLALVGLGWRWVHRDLGRAGAAAVGLWAPAEVRPGLSLGFTMLPASVIGAAYNLGLPAAAAAQLGRVELGLYYLVDRAVRTVIAALDPLMQLVYPRIVERFAASPRAALAYALRWAAGGLVAGLAIGLGVWLAWPLLPALAPPLDWARLQPVYAVLGWLLPLCMGWRFLGYWMLGSGRYDRAYRACIVVGAVIGLGGAWWFGRSAVALAGVGVAAEFAVMLAAFAGMALTERARRR